MDFKKLNVVKKYLNNGDEELYGDDLLASAVISRICSSNEPSYCNTVINLDRMLKNAGINPDELIICDDEKRIHLAVLDIVDKKFLDSNPELIPFYEYLPDGGHSIYCVLQYFMENIEKYKTSDDIYRHCVVPLPLDYVRLHGFTWYKGFPVCSAKFSPELGCCDAEVDRCERF